MGLVLDAPPSMSCSAPDDVADATQPHSMRSSLDGAHPEPRHGRCSKPAAAELHDGTRSTLSTLSNLSTLRPLAPSCTLSTIITLEPLVTLAPMALMTPWPKERDLDLLPGQGQSPPTAAASGSRDRYGASPTGQGNRSHWVSAFARGSAGPHGVAGGGSADSTLPNARLNNPSGSR